MAGSFFTRRFAYSGSSCTLEQPGSQWGEIRLGALILSMPDGGDDPPQGSQIFTKNLWAPLGMV